MPDNQSLSVYTVNAFTDKSFGGNPAAVVPLTVPLSDKLMQSIAAQHNLSETAFLEQLGPDHYRLRWFTPVNEVPLCGHATLASAFALCHSGAWQSERLCFETASGQLWVSRYDTTFSIDFPAVPMVKVPVSDAFERALGVNILGAYRPQENAWQMVCEVENEATVRACSPNFEALTAATDLGVSVTARGSTTHFVSRFFIPQMGVNEDPVTGSAHCQLSPFWGDRLGLTQMSALQLSERGGELDCKLKGDRVVLSGRCVLFAEGRLYLPADV